MLEVAAFGNLRKKTIYSRVRHPVALKKEPVPKPADSLVRHLVLDDNLLRQGELKNSIRKVLHLKDIEAIERIADGDLQFIEITFEGMSEGTAIWPQARGARRPSFMRQPETHSGTVNSSFWGGEFREAAWVASIIGGLSVTTVGLATMIAIALE